MVRLADSEGADARIAGASRRPGDSRHDPLVFAPDRGGAGGLLHMGYAMGGAGVRHFRRHLRRERRFTLARVRPRHGVQDRLDERRRLRDRIVHDPARIDVLALEPHAPPQRHHHRRPRSGNRRAAPDEHARIRAEFFQHRHLQEIFHRHRAAQLRPPCAGRGDVHPRVRAAGRVRACAHLRRDLRDYDRSGDLLRQPAAADVHRSADVLRLVADGDVRLHAARRPGGERARSSAELPHGVHEPGAPVPVLEYELPRRASHVPAGAVSQSAEAARGDQDGLPDAVRRHSGCVA